jgi:2,3-bisphosphoglycerate-dependent phosphoglycerate mutase
MKLVWPERLWLIRHGESAGNVARDAADKAGLSRIAITGRDVDVALSPEGVAQAQALGHWFAARPSQDRPEIVLSSPYVRARASAEHLIRSGALTSCESGFVVDERLREKEFGILDGLTRAGIREFYPEQAQFREVIGKFYHRPPGGESWCDVILRLRSVLDTLSLHYAGRRVLIMTHQVVVLCLRYLLEKMDERKILEVDAAGDVFNCGVTEYAYEEGRGESTGTLALRRYNFVAPLRREGVPVTAAPDLGGGRR